MFIKIPFESEIEFKTNIKEITKMSLEHDYNLSECVVLGNFYITGEYKIHEVSVNTTPFEYTLPFSVELRNDIKCDTLEFNIEDFSYEIINDNTLKIFIEYSLKAEEEDLFKKIDEEELTKELELIDNTEDERKGELDSEPVLEVEKIEENTETFQKEEDTIDDNKTIMNTIKDGDDTYVTYHVHLVNAKESIESIAAMYNVSVNIINEYNNITEINEGDKIIIPCE